MRRSSSVKTNRPTTTFKVRVFLGDKQLDPADYKKIVIVSPVVDKIVNEVYEQDLVEESVSETVFKT